MGNSHSAQNQTRQNHRTGANRENGNSTKKLNHEENEFSSVLMQKDRLLAEEESDASNHKREEKSSDEEHIQDESIDMDAQSPRMPIPHPHSHNGQYQTATLVLDEGVVETLRNVLNWQVQELTQNTDSPQATPSKKSPTVIHVSPKKSNSNKVLPSRPLRKRRIHPKRDSNVSRQHTLSKLTTSPSKKNNRKSPRDDFSSIVDNVKDKYRSKDDFKTDAQPKEKGIEESIPTSINHKGNHDETEIIEDETIMTTLAPKSNYSSIQRPKGRQGARKPVQPERSPQKQQPQLYPREDVPEDIMPEPTAPLSVPLPSFARPTLSFNLRKRKPVRPYQPMHMKRHSVPTPYVGRPTRRQRASPYPHISTKPKSYSSTPPPRRASELNPRDRKLRAAFNTPQITSLLESSKRRKPSFTDLGEIPVNGHDLSVNHKPLSIPAHIEAKYSAPASSEPVAETPQRGLHLKASAEIPTSPISPSHSVASSFVTIESTSPSRMENGHHESDQALQLSVLDHMKRAERQEDDQDYLSALQTYKKALQLSKSVRDKGALVPTISQRISDLLDAQSLAYASEGNIQKAVDYAKRSIQIQASLGFVHGQLCSLFQLATVYTKEALYTEAIGCLMDMTKLQRKEERLAEEVEITRKIGQLYRMMKNYPATMHYMEKCSQLQKKLTKAQIPSKRERQIRAIYGSPPVKSKPKWNNSIYLK